MNTGLEAGLWGLVSGSPLVMGAAVAWLAPVPQRLIAAIMAFGSGVLISALSFELMDEAWQQGGIASSAIGFMGGAMVYTGANIVLSNRGARHRKRSQNQPEPETGSGTALAVGALLDGIPESVVIGVSMIRGGAVSWVAVTAIFLSNVPEGLSSAAGMKKAGRSALYVFGLWGAIALASGLAAWSGYAVFAAFQPGVIAATEAFAAGAILAMIADTMIPEAFETTRDYAGLITVAGFLAAFTLSKLGG